MSKSPDSAHNNQPNTAENEQIEPPRRALSGRSGLKAALLVSAGAKTPVAQRFHSIDGSSFDRLSSL